MIWALLGCTGSGAETGPAELDTGEPVVRDSGDTGVALPPGTFDLVAADGWVLDASVDPFPGHLDGHTCDPSGVLVEDGLLEVRTGDCAYAVVRQANLAEVGVGDRLELLVYHSALTADEEGEGHVALALDGDVVWEKTVGIPSTSQVYATEWSAEAAVAVGADVVLHLHNHGSNAWNLGHLRVSR